MEQQLQTILLDDSQNTIKIFQKNEFYYIYTHLHLFSKFVLSEYNTKQKELRIIESQYQEIVKHVILTLRMQLIEYKNTTNDLYMLTKKALYSNWDDYADILYNDLYQPVSAIYYEQKNIYISFYNMLNNTIFYASFEDDDIFSILYSFLTEINCSQVFFENARLQKPLENMNVSLNFVKNTQNNINTHKIADKNIHKSINILVQTQNLRDYKLCEYKTNDFMKIDNKTIETLDIPHIFNLLQPYTKQGKRLLSQMIKQPLKNIEMIEKRLAFTEYFYNFSCEIVKGFPDFIVYSKRILKLKIKDCVTIYYGLQRLQNLIERIQSNLNNENTCSMSIDSVYKINKENNEQNDVNVHDKTSHTHNTNTINIYNLVNDELLLPLTSINKTNEQLFVEMRKIIDFETNELKANFSEKIQELKVRKEEIEQKIKEEYERVFEINKKTKIENTQNETYQFKIPRSEYKIFAKHNFVEKSMLKSGILFTTKNLETYNAELVKINSEYSKEEKYILDNFLIFMNNYSTSLEALNHLIAMIDVYIAFGKSKDYGFTKPKFDSYFSVKGVFHPLISECVKNDIDLGLTQNSKNKSGCNTQNNNAYNKKNGFSGCANNENIINDKFCVITGPNMGGKSTFMKQCALLCIFAQIGCFVPADSATLPIINGIYLRIGANDVSSKGMSTFMVEMNDIARICKNADSNTLVIVDELGRGTSAIDGLSLALSVKEYLISKNSYTLFATHFPELCSSDIINKRVASEYNNDELVLLYKIEDGVCDVSYGVEIAEKIGFPKEVVSYAKMLNNKDETK